MTAKRPQTMEESYWGILLWLALPCLGLVSFLIPIQVVSKLKELGLILVYSTVDSRPAKGEELANLVFQGLRK